MKKISTYDEYTQILADFKAGKARCSTNKMYTRSELETLIAAGKLYHDEIEDVLWFFVNEGYFYTAGFYVPADMPIRMRRQDMDVLVELTGNPDRYNQKWEDELIAAGYEKRDKYLEYASQMSDIIDDVKKQNQVMHAFWEKRGFHYRTATKEDYPEMMKLWEEKLGKHRYTLNSMTEAELDEMEKYGRCVVICDKEGKICATNMYIRRGTTAYGLHGATYYQGSGLGGVVLYDQIVHMVQEGIQKHIGWVREDNIESISLQTRLGQRRTGKFYIQFVYESESPSWEKIC